MSQLHLSFLGHPEVRHGERLLNFRTRKVLALLIFLAVEGGRHSREKLTTFFWPESDHKSGRATLRSTLLYLRRALQHTDKDAPTHLIVTRETLSFNSDMDYTLDCETLSRLARSPDPLSNDPMAPLLTLYRGDFLEGFTLPDAPAFDEWARIQREQYHLHMNEMFDRLSQITAARGATPDGIQVINRWLALNPLHEPAYRRLIRLHLTDENRAAAQQVYEACRHHFQEELGIELSPETMALAEQIRAGTRSRPVPIKEETPPLAPLADTLLPFVGRAVEHTELVTAYHTARQGRLQLIVVEGEAGIGKTRLAHEFLAWAAAQGADILVGQAFETGGRLPYQPIVAALRDRIEQENAPEDLLADIWLSELSRLLPELGDRYPDLPPPLAKETAVPSRLFEAVTRLVQALTVRKSVVIFMDDMQWADSATLDLLAYAVRRWHERAVSLVLLLTLRTEALAQVPGSLTLPAVAAWLPGLARHLEIKRLKLPPLTTAATRELVQKASQEREESTPANSNLRPTILFAKWLFGETEGHPLFMTETVKNLLDEGILVKRGEVWDVAAALRLVEETFDKTFIPPGIREIVHGRLSRLSTIAFNCLAAAAVWGRPFNLKQLCQVADVQIKEGLSALDELLNGRLLTTINERYQFTHDKIRDVAYAEAGPARRQLFHERTFAYLQESQAEPVQLAHHAQIAGLEAEAFRYSLAAGDEAMRLFAVKEAIRYYEQARLLSNQVTGNRKPLEHLYLQLGRSYELDNAWDKARATYQAMRQHAQEVNAPRLEIVALNRLATVVLHAAFDGEQTAAYLHEAETLAARFNDQAGLAETEWNLSHLAIYTLDRQAALEHGERALLLARELDQRELIARSLNALAYAEMGLPGRLAAGQLHAEEARTLYAGLGNRAMEIDCLAGIASCNIHRGQPRTGVAELRQAYDMSQAIENGWGQVNCTLHLAFGLVECGQYGEALSVINAGVDLARRHQFSGLLAHALTIRGSVYRAMWALNQAVADHQEAWTIFSSLPMPDTTPFLAVHLCADYALLNKWTEALPHAQLAATSDHLNWLFAWLNAGFIYWPVIETLLHQGKVSQAQTAVTTLGQLAGSNPRYQIPHLRCLAVLAEGDRNMAGAAAYLEEALALAETIGLPGEQWPILAKLAHLENKRGRAETAGSLRQQAGHIIQEIAGHIDDGALQEGFLEGTAVVLRGL